jgi:formylglycine-generating enzyme required for sulfatase activity
MANPPKRAEPPAAEPDDESAAALQRKIAELQAKLARAHAGTAESGANPPPKKTAKTVIETAGGAAVKGPVQVSNGHFIGRDFIVNNYLAAGGTCLSPDEIAMQVAGYLRWLRERTQNIELRGIERAGGAPVVMLPLETAYVPLRARPAPRVGLDRHSLGAQRPSGQRMAAEALAEEHGEHEADIALNQVLGLGNRLAIIGGPGSGKTTVLLHMAWALASSLLSGEAEPAQSRLGLTALPGALPLPIFVPLASFARYRRDLPSNAPAREKTLAHFISRHLISQQADFDLPADFFVQLLKNGRGVVLLLDGLDEVANEDERAQVRQSVEELVSGREAMRVLVTCRTVAYRSGRTALGAAFREIAVQPLDAELHIAPMVRQAYACIYPHDSALRTQRETDLISGIAQLEADRQARQGEVAETLVNSPLMVRLLLIVHFNNRALPDERAELFDKAINALLQVDYGRDESVIRELTRDWKLWRDMAQHLAFHMHQQGDDQGRDIDEPALKAALRQENDFKPHIEAFLTHARQRGSVLEERDGMYRFIHLAFQEFLVARYLNDIVGEAGGQAAILADLSKRLDDPWWREPILLLAGYKGAKTARPARLFVQALARAGDTPDTRFCAAELAGTAALAWRDCGTSTRADCAARLAELLADDAALKVSRPPARARAGDALSKLGDPRFDAQRLYLPADGSLGFVRIAADPAFCIGTRKSDHQRVAAIIRSGVNANEINDVSTPTPAFQIARYLVTVAQFRAFVEATQFELGDPDALRDPDSRPVRWVSWHEAVAYCAWLNERLKSSPLFDGDAIAHLVRADGWQVALPHELEWEKAARGGLKNAVFSWGDTPDHQRANYANAGVGNTSAVGCFPANGFGLFDMIGNVWEWTRSEWGSRSSAMNDLQREGLNASDEVLRGVRGGSFGDPAYGARCACRFGFRPGDRDYLLGFRVVLRSAPVSNL